MVQLIGKMKKIRNGGWVAFFNLFCDFFDSDLHKNVSIWTRIGWGTRCCVFREIWPSGGKIFDFEVENSEVSQNPYPVNGGKKLQTTFWQLCRVGICTKAVLSEAEFPDLHVGNYIELIWCCRAELCPLERDVANRGKTTKNIMGGRVCFFTYFITSSIWIVITMFLSEAELFGGHVAVNIEAIRPTGGKIFVF